MPITDSDRQIVDALFDAMRAGADGEEATMTLFADDAVLTEPFTGEKRTHHGAAAIRASFQEQWSMPLPALTITLDGLHEHDGRLRADWTCDSPVFPSPMKGHDLLVIRDGAIANLEVVITEMPPMGD